MLTIREAAPLLLGPTASPRTLQKRLKNSVTTTAGRAKWAALDIDPDTVRTGINDPWTDAMGQVLGLIVPPSFPEPSPPPKPKPKPAPPKRTTNPNTSLEQRGSNPPSLRRLTLGLIFALPLAESYSFYANAAHIYPDLGPMGATGWAVVGYLTGLATFANYARMTDQARAELWAGVLALFQFLVHMGGAQWNLYAVPVSCLIVASAWATNAAYRKQ